MVLQLEWKFFSPAFDEINEINWDQNIQWLIDNHFTGIITYKNFEKLQSKLSKDPTLQVIPITFNQDELVEIEDKYQPLNIINKK
ncbi:hypothetical protein [Fructilactobacillus lindneri]|uniref:hypothetical protein n=1 Tax=Fructilactobacillus lindneri TaxID=53444 RepID=UPI00117BA21D|nr:hypothetical protein [Fructilactobacillus lindneri]